MSTPTTIFKAKKHKRRNLILFHWLGQVFCNKATTGMHSGSCSREASSIRGWFIGSKQQRQKIPNCVLCAANRKTETWTPCCLLSSIRCIKHQLSCCSRNTGGKLGINTILQKRPKHCHTCLKQIMFSCSRNYKRAQGPELSPKCWIIITGKTQTRQKAQISFYILIHSSAVSSTRIW